MPRLERERPPALGQSVCDQQPPGRKKYSVPCGEERNTFIIDVFAPSQFGEMKEGQRDSEQMPGEDTDPL